MNTTGIRDAAPHAGVLDEANSGARRRARHRRAPRPGRRPTFANDVQYIHHVPGRLRLQNKRLEDRCAAAQACDAAKQIPAVTDARANMIIGSVVITYDRRRLAPSALWDALCRLNLASGPLPIRNGVLVTRAEIGVATTRTAIKRPIAIVANAVVDKLLERWGAALLAALF